MFLPPENLSLTAPEDEEPSVVQFDWVERDVIVLSQSCDLEKGHEKVAEVLLCAIWPCAEVGGHLATARGMEDARRGNLPAHHMLAPCDLPGYQSDVVVVDFRRVHTLPLSYFRNRASSAGNRIRLLPPYREHLAQAFARFFMRVGLPVPIAPFRELRQRRLLLFRATRPTTGSPTSFCQASSLTRSSASTAARRGSADRSFSSWGSADRSKSWYLLIFG